MLMATDFDRYASMGREIVHHLDLELGGQGPEHAGRVLRAVLHALRNRLTTAESIHLVAQLPMALKGIYVDGWKMGNPDHRIRTAEDLAQEVIREGGRTAWRDFSGTGDANRALQAVMKILSEYVSPREWSDIEANLPADLRASFHSWHARKV